ncbi:putative SOS response-associated peptidase YedK [Stella humosa]|uniref:Abasic site processing protein n=1 Tax=Stella humosa TaxID=94 RepID=A0A3N1MBL8_9PROT|nr:SOS response-associated peptidase [Stella humosa]ROQ00097.1 putative SOS response-associated peptidase YedK [Stella humosa]BBK30668.1 DUF159 family protein [Stella humosa]
MCARYSITTAPEAIARLFRTAGPLPNLPPRYNLAPTQSAPVVRPGGEGRRLDLLRWGLIPSWSKGPDARFSMINARADTLAVKPAYRNALRERRCLVPADGFYEWQGAGKAKRPMRMVRPDRAPFAFAGLWERWQPADGSPAVESFTIVTTDANDRLRPIHDRMPVILDEADWDRWLAGPADAVTGLLRPAPDAALVAYPVSQRVGNVRNDDPDLLLEAPETLLL